MTSTSDRPVGRLPAWARSRPGPRALIAVAAVALLVVLAVVLGGGSGGRADVPVLADGPDAGVVGVRSPSDRTGGTLRVVASDIDSLDPQRSYLPGVWNLMRLYARTLVTYTSEPGETDQLVPDLATDLGTPSEDGLSWTFTLRDGVTFEGGRPITSRDVKYGIERSFASDVIVGGPTYVVDLFDDPENQYAGPYQDEAPDRLGLAAVETPDDRTIVFRLRAPQPDLPFVLALPSSSPVPIESDTGGGYEADPVSSGPYAVTSVDPAAGILLERNPSWDPATDGVRTALPDRVVVRTGMSGLERDQAVLAGSADIDLSGTGVQPATTARLRVEDTPLLDRVDDLTTGTVRLLALPTDVAPMNDPACRRAVASAVDRPALQERLRRQGDAVRNSTLWPQTLEGGPEDPDPRPDLAAARAALAECGQPDGFATVLAVPDSTTSVQVAEQVSAQLAEVGIDTEVRALDAATFYTNDVGNPGNVLANGYGIILTTWTADFPTPGSFLVPLVDGRVIAAVNNTNYARLDDPGINALVDQARAAADAATWREVAEAAAATNAYVPLVETRVQLVSGQRLRNGLVMEPYTGYDLATAGVR